MIKFITAILLTALLSFAIGMFQFLPWFIFVFCAFIVAIAIPQKPGKAFLSGFIALFLLWAIMAFTIDKANEHILAKKVAQILPLGGSYIALILITGLVGGLLAGLAALTGSFVRKK
jgi:FtsH-binding integral membrane protein